MKKNKFAALIAVSIGVSVGAAAPAMASEMWNIKCFDQSGHTMAVKAFTSHGVNLDIKAMPVDGTDHLDIKAISESDNSLHHVKVVPSQDDKDYSDVKAITDDNKLIHVKGVSAKGITFHVKAMPNDATGEFDIKCLGTDGTVLALKAISPGGMVYDVKGLPELKGQKDLEVEIEAHIKARPQQ
ncbi:MAG: hypothetical protein V7723_13215 [Sneathiella sp.]|uniref:DUF7486 family protein n=1 Tax=Sneathiella sp. TaxID=1964365 RepID=UPI003002F6A4